MRKKNHHQTPSAIFHTHFVHKVARVIAFIPTHFTTRHLYFQMAWQNCVWRFVKTTYPNDWVTTHSELLCLITDQCDQFAILRPDKPSLSQKKYLDTLIAVGKQSIPLPWTILPVNSPYYKYTMIKGVLGPAFHFSVKYRHFSQ